MHFLAEIESLLGERFKLKVLLFDAVLDIVKLIYQVTIDLFQFLNHCVEVLDFLFFKLETTL